MAARKPDLYRAVMWVGGVGGEKERESHESQLWGIQIGLKNLQSFLEDLVPQLRLMSYADIEVSGVSPVTLGSA